MNYESAVRQIRQQDQFRQLVTDSYLDADVLAAANRFYESEEFAEVRKVAEKFINVEHANILDIGCGNGIASYAWAKTEAYVTAADIDCGESVGILAANKLAKHFADDYFKVVRCRAEQLPFLKDSYDLVYARQALHHFQDLKLALLQCSAALKTGGILFATREHVIDDTSQLQEFLNGHPLHALHGGEYAYTLRQYQEAIESAGLTLEVTFAPFDSVINHFPISNGEISKWFSEGLNRRFGNLIGSSLSKSRTLLRLYRYKLSYSCRYPGRLYSFLAIKK